MTLDQAINLCLLADPKLRAGFEAINQANADALTASLKPNPELFTDIQLLPLTRPFTVDMQGGPPQQDVNVSYPIDWFLFGKRAAAMAGAALGVRVSEAEYANLVRERVTETALAYYDVVEARALLDLARQDVENLAKVESVTRKAVEGGGRPRVELSRVQLDLLKSQQALRDADATLTSARATLRGLLGRAVSDPNFDVAGTLDAPLAAEPPPVEEALAAALQFRPDLHALRWKVAQSQADVETERRKGFPTLTPQLGYTRQYQTKAIGFPDANSWSAAITMPLPFSDRNQGNRLKAQATAVQNQFELQAGEVALRAELESVLAAFRAARANADAIAQQQLKLAGEVRDSINKAYEAGGRPLLDVLDAQRNFRDTYRLYISSRAGYWRALYKFQSAIGRQVMPHDGHPGSQPPASPP
jgi:cobalt-zinc-cadmium efflux system outer membrane protein